MVCCYDEYINEGETVKIVDHHQGNIYIVKDSNNDNWFITANHLEIKN